MSTAFIEDPRVTQYRHRLAELLHRPSCCWISFAIGTAPVHRGFFADTAEAIEGLPTSDVRHENGVSHRQVQYGVRLKIVTDEAAEACYDLERDILVVPGEAALDSLDSQAKLVGACVHLGLDIESRNQQPLDCESAARISGHLYRLLESIADDLGESGATDRIKQLRPELPADNAFFDIAVEILRHHRATLRANRRVSHPLQPGSFMKIVGIGRREQLHDVLLEGTARLRRRPSAKPALPTLPRASRFLALQAVELAMPRALQQDQLATCARAHAEPAQKADRFRSEIVPAKVVMRKDDVPVKADKYPRHATVEALPRVAPAFQKSSTVTAGSPSGITDATAAVVSVAVEAAVRRDVRPLARIGALATAAVDPTLMGP